MSIITSFLPRGGPLLSGTQALTGPPVDNPPELGRFTDELQFMTHKGRQCELLTIVEDEEKKFVGEGYEGIIFSNSQRFLENGLKKAFLREVCYSIPKIYFYFRPETSVMMGARFVVKQLSGSMDEDYIDHLIKNNPGLFNYLVPIFKIAQIMYRTGGLRATGVPEDLHRAIVHALMEVVNLNRQEMFRGPALASQWLKDVGCRGNFNHKKSFLAQSPTGLEYNLTSLHYVCFECGELTRDAKQWKTHAKDHKKYRCRTCELEFKKYEDKVHHVLTFCREPFNNGNCHYCGLSGRQCTCVKYMKETFTIMTEYLHQQEQDIKDNVFESDFYSAWIHYQDKQLARQDLKKTNFMPQNLENPPNKDLLPQFSFEGNHICEELSGERVLLSTIKASLRPKCETFHEMQSEITSYMDLVRAKCPYSPCPESFEKVHLHEKHFLCPIAAGGENEKIKIYNETEFLQHIIHHYKDEFPEQQIFCHLCNYEVRNGGHVLSYAYHFDEKHLNKLKEHHCTVDSECKALYFTTMSSWMSHYFAFHVNDADSMRIILPILCEAAGVRVEMLLKEDKKIEEKPSKVSPTKVVQIDEGINTMTGGESHGDNVNYTNIGFPEPRNGQVNNFKRSVARGNDKENKEEDKYRVSEKDNEPNRENNYVCENEEHLDPKPRFRTADLLELHIIAKHKCAVFKCNFATMMASDMLQHFKSKHARETRECPICGASTTDMEQHQQDAHPTCPSCHERFSTLHDLQKHEVSCGETKSKDIIEKKPPVGTLGVPDTSLNLDNTNTEQMFNQCLMKMLEASNLSEEEKQQSALVLAKHTSESVLTKSRLRNDSLGFQRSQNLLFDIPNFCTEAGASTNVTKAASLLGNVRNDEIFDAHARDAAKMCINNFEKVEILCRKLHTVTTLCSLTESQAKCFLSSYLSQNVIDVLSGYTRREIHDLSFREILQNLQNIYIPLSLNILEQRVYSYVPEPNSCLFEFSSKVRRHLSIVARRYPEEERDRFIEEGINKILRSHLPPAVARTVEAKERLFTQFSASEILDIYLSYNNQAAQATEVEHQYEIFSNSTTRDTQASLRTSLKNSNRTRGQGTPGTGLRPEPGSRKARYRQGRGRGRGQGGQVHEVQKPAPGGQRPGGGQGPNQTDGARARTYGVSEASKKKIEALGDKYRGKFFCFTCLDLQDPHVRRRCTSGLTPSDTLCYLNGAPHGYHNQCKKGQEAKQNNNNNNNQRGRGRPNWGPRS